MQGTTYIWASSTSINNVYVRSDTPNAKLNVEWFQYIDFLQIDSGWKDDLYANHPLSDRVPLYPNPLTDTTLPSVNILGGTMGSSGCLTTSVAMGLSTVGAYITPKKLNQDMKNSSAGYYNSSNYVQPFTLTDFSNGKITSTRKNATISEVKTELDNGNIVIANVPYKDTRTDCTHWLIVKKLLETNIILMTLLLGIEL